MRATFAPYAHIALRVLSPESGDLKGAGLIHNASLISIDTRTVETGSLSIRRWIKPAGLRGRILKT